MDLISNYGSNLSTFLYLELLQLLEQNVTQGEYSAGTLFDVAAAQALQAQGQDFSSLPIPSAGDRAMAYSLNYPLSLLTARYAAIASERQDFVNRLNLYMSVLEKDALLIDFLLAAANLRDWAAQRPQLSEASQFYEDFTRSLGQRGSLPLIDPSNPTLVHPAANAQLPIVSFLAEGVLIEGACPPANVSLVPPTNLSWSFTSTAENETLGGADWAKLSILEDAPLLVVGSPVTTQLAPAGTNQTTGWHNFFAVAGASNSGNLPVFVQTAFLPRRSLLNVCVTQLLDGFPLSVYQILQDRLRYQLVVYPRGRFYA